MADVPGIQTDQSEFNRWKHLTVLNSICVNRKGIEIRQLCSLEIVLNIQEKGFTISKTISDCKRGKI